jgi:hypothetical protein
MAISEVQNLFKHGKLKDPALEVVIKMNTRKWKSVNDERKIVIKVDKAKQEENWKAIDQKVKDTYPNYDAEKAEGVIETALAERKAEKLAAKQKQQNINVDLKENNEKLSPPVKGKAAEKNQIKLKK